MSLQERYERLDPTQQALFRQLADEGCETEEALDLLESLKQ